jgi:cell division protein FtsQ
MIGLDDEGRPRLGPDRRYWRRRANREVRKARRLRIGVRWLGALAAHLALVGVLVYLAVRAAHHLRTTESLALARVDVRGAERTSGAAIEAALASLRGTNLLRLDLDDVERRVAADPWVLRSSAKRVFPGTLRVEIVERTPAAVALLDGAAYAVDGDAQVIGPCGPGLADDLPVLTGLDHLGGDDRVGALARGVRAVRELVRRNPAWAARVSEIDVSAGDRLVVVTSDPGPRVLLDPVEVGRNLDPYLALRAHLEERVGPASYVDLRWSDRIALRPE